MVNTEKSMMIYSESRTIEKGMYYGAGKDIILQDRELRRRGIKWVVGRRRFWEHFFKTL